MRTRDELKADFGVIGRQNLKFGVLEQLRNEKRSFAIVFDQHDGHTAAFEGWQVALPLRLRARIRGRNANGESGTQAYRAFQTDFAAEQASKIAAQRQAKPSTFGFL